MFKKIIINLYTNYNMISIKLHEFKLKDIEFKANFSIQV